MDDPRLDAQLRFILEADQLKKVDRRGTLADGSRVENSAEHSWHLALMAMLLAEHASPSVDVLRVVQMVLIHDVVEIDAGDTFIYDEEGRADKAERESVAAQRLFAMLPSDQAAWLHALRDEFERRETPEARFAASLDRLAPLMLNHASGGIAWQHHQITVDQVRTINAHIADGSPALWDSASALIDDAVEQGFLAED